MKREEPAHRGCEYLAVGLVVTVLRVHGRGGYHTLEDRVEFQVGGEFRGHRGHYRRCCCC